MNTILWVISIICAIYVLYDVWAVQKKMSGGTKIVWSIFAIIFNIITAIVYYFMVKKK